jgi:gluconokinase
MIVIVMGVVGAGKTTIGTLLASQLGWEFTDADDFHPQSNVDKIHHGIPLTDEDRQPWLDRLREAITGWISANKSVVLACSALKRAYRAKLSVGPQVRFVYLKGSAAQIADRLRLRHGHFASEAILASQLADLEEPDPAITVDINDSPDQIVAEIRSALATRIKSSP